MEFSGSMTPGGPGLPAERVRGKSGAAGSLFKLLLALYFLASFFTGVFLAGHRPDFYMSTDGREYLEAALSFAETGGMTIARGRYYEAPRETPMPDAYRPPLLPFLTGLLLKAGLPPLLAMPLLQALFSVLTAVLLFRCGAMLSPSASNLAGWGAPVLYFLTPSIQYSVIHFSSEPLFFLLIACMLHAFLCWRKSSSLLAAGGAGLAGALTLWTRPTGLIFLPAVAAVLLLAALLLPEWKDHRKKLLAGACLFAAVFSLGVLPNAIRNRVLFGTFQPDGFLSGFTCRFSNRVENLNAYRAGGGKAFLKWQDKAWEKTLQEIKALPPEYSGDPARQNKLLLARTKQEIGEMGAKSFAFLLAAKAWHFIRPWPVTDIHARWKFLLLAVTESLIYLAGFSGLALLLREPGEKRLFALVLLGIMAAGCLAHALVHVNFRYRIPFIDLPLLFPAGIFLAQLFRRFARNAAKAADKPPAPSAANTQSTGSAGS